MNVWVICHFEVIFKARMCFAIIRFRVQKVMYNWALRFASEKKISSSKNCQEGGKTVPAPSSITWASEDKPGGEERCGQTSGNVWGAWEGSPAVD